MNVSEELIREIVQKVLEESTAKQAPAVHCFLNPAILSLRKTWCL